MDTDSELEARLRTYLARRAEGSTVHGPDRTELSSQRSSGRRSLAVLVSALATVFVVLAIAGGFVVRHVRSPVANTSHAGTTFSPAPSGAYACSADNCGYAGSLTVTGALETDISWPGTFVPNCNTYDGGQTLYAAGPIDSEYHFMIALNPYHGGGTYSAASPGVAIDRVPKYEAAVLVFGPSAPDDRWYAVSGTVMIDQPFAAGRASGTLDADLVHVGTSEHAHISGRWTCSHSGD